MTQVLSHPVHTTGYMDRPFGYGFFSDSNRDEPAPPPEQPPAQGRPLLNENETNINNALFGNIEDPRLLEQLHQFPTSEPIPNLFGATSSFGHPGLNLNHALTMFQQSQGFHPGPLSAPAHSMSFSPQVHNPPFEAPGQQQSQQPQQPPSRPPLQQQAQGQAPPMLQHHRAQSSSFVKPLQNAQLAAMQRRQLGQARPTMEGIRRASSDYLPTMVGGDLYSHTAKEMLKEGREARPDSYLERRMTFTYGSDSGFKGSSYNPPKSVLTHTQNLEAQKVHAVRVGYKGPNVRPVSANGLEEPQSARSAALDSIADDSEAEQEESRKRRRGDRDDSDDEDLVLGLSRKKSRPQLSMSIPPAPNTPGNDMTPSTPGGTNRKSSDAKPARVNLTEEEKKMNHIRSEQKRRNQIKEGFADLTDLMPDAASAGPSKCTILAKAVEWVSDLIEGNKKLRDQLNSLTGANIKPPQ